MLPSDGDLHGGGRVVFGLFAVDPTRYKIVFTPLNKPNPDFGVAIAG